MKMWVTTGVMWLLLVGAASGGTAAPAGPDNFQTLWDEWGEIFFVHASDQRSKQLSRLRPRVEAFAARHPNQAEPLILEAVVLCSSAASDIGFGALRAVERARDLLLESIEIDPTARSAAAYLTLGNLYYRLPGWPLSFGDKNRGRAYFKAALASSPDSIDTIYFYGNTLLDQDQYEQALPFLEKAARAPIRSENRWSDLNVKSEIRGALQHARDKKRDDSNYFDRVVRSVLIAFAAR